jgi:hypothetical protein
MRNFSLIFDNFLILERRKIRVLSRELDDWEKNEKQRISIEENSGIFF